MFACIYGPNLSKAHQACVPQKEDEAPPLVTLAFTFSPLVELTSGDTVVFDISGQGLLFAPSAGGNDAPATDMKSARNLAKEVLHRGKTVGLQLSVAVAANPDVAIHAARFFQMLTVIDKGAELSRLKSISIKQLDCSLAGVETKRAAEILETFRLWGVETFGDLARLPVAGVAERLGQEGVRLRKLARGETERHLKLVRPPVGFEQSLALEHPIHEIEPLSFILSRLLNQLCANLLEYAIATNELHLDMKLNDKSEQRRILTLPVPMRDPKILLRLLLFDIEREPPKAPIVAIAIRARPVEPRASQHGLFIPLQPEPEKLEITLARLAKLAGAENVGSPEFVDTHRPDAFRMKKFNLSAGRKRGRRNPQFAAAAGQPVMGFRMFRPPWPAQVQTMNGQPARIDARAGHASGRVRGKVVCAAGPWRASGDWWRPDVWARDEWDVAVMDVSSQPEEVLCRIYREPASDEWFLAGMYD